MRKCLSGTGIRESLILEWFFKVRQQKLVKKMKLLPSRTINLINIEVTLQSKFIQKNCETKIQTKTLSYYNIHQLQKINKWEYQ